jgi:TRAP-type C4-dicarboxylate transport system substrate-binding protein
MKSQKGVQTMHHRNIRSVTVIAIVGFFMLCAMLRFASPLAAADKTVVWNIPHTAAPSYYHIINLKAFAEKVKELSKGQMEIRVHPASSLYPQQEQIPAVVEGRVEIAPILTSYMVDLFLPMAVLELPFMTSSLDEHRAAAEKLRPFYEEQLGKKDILLLAISTWPTQQLFSTKKPIDQVEDWKGLKVRVYGTETAELTKALGGAPVNIPFAEVYTALQRNVADAAITSATNAEHMKFSEVAKHINYWFIGGGACEFLGVNKKAWNSLSPELQKAVKDALKESRFEDKEWEDAKALDANAKKRCTELGMTVVEVPQAEIVKARSMMKPAWDAWLKRTGDDGKRAVDLALKALGR